MGLKTLPDTQRKDQVSKRAAKSATITVQPGDADPLDETEDKITLGLRMAAIGAENACLLAERDSLVTEIAVQKSRVEAAMERVKHTQVVHKSHVSQLSRELAQFRSTQLSDDTQSKRDALTYQLQMESVQRELNLNKIRTDQARRDFSTTHAHHKAGPEEFLSEMKGETGQHKIKNSGKAQPAAEFAVLRDWRVDPMMTFAGILRTNDLTSLLYLLQSYERLNLGPQTGTSGSWQTGSDAAVVKPAMIKFPDNHTPLHLAAAEGNAEVCELLLEHGADINAQTLSCGATAAMYCVPGVVTSGDDGLGDAARVNTWRTLMAWPGIDTSISGHAGWCEGKTVMELASFRGLTMAVAAKMPAIDAQPRGTYVSFQMEEAQFESADTADFLDETSEKEKAMLGGFMLDEGAVADQMVPGSENAAAVSMVDSKVAQIDKNAQDMKRKLEAQLARAEDDAEEGMSDAPVEALGRAMGMTDEVAEPEIRERKPIIAAPEEIAPVVTKEAAPAVKAEVAPAVEEGVTSAVAKEVVPAQNHKDNSSSSNDAGGRKSAPIAEKATPASKPAEASVSKPSVEQKVETPKSAVGDYLGEVYEEIEKKGSLDI